MKAISVLGTSSNAGKSWLVTALGAWLRRQGLKVVPFKAQNMSNNSYVTLEGGEIGRAQAVQAAACGVRPVAEHNPVLLKPCGNSISQLILLGQPQQHIQARDYYQYIDQVWQVVADTLDYWSDRCDILLLEGAGSPVELNLMHRDIVNLRPIQYLNERFSGQWLLVGDIERGGVFAQLIGTYSLMPDPAKSLGLGCIVNKFRGDLSLFADASKYFAHHLPELPYLGTLPYCGALQPESEDSLCQVAEEFGDGEMIAWIRFPHLSNSQDSQPWQLDRGVRTSWVKDPEAIASAKAIILPGSKNTLADLLWLQETGLAQAIVKAAQQGTPIVGICGGYQMLGLSLSDPQGKAGQAGIIPGLGLLPITTTFETSKEVRQVAAMAQGETWTAYEIHMGRTQLIEAISQRYSIRSIASSAIGESAIGKPEVVPLVKINAKGEIRPEGIRQGHIWGTYLHGLFESTNLRRELTGLAQISGYQPSAISWSDYQVNLYDSMADVLEQYLDLVAIRQYVGC